MISEPRVRERSETELTPSRLSMVVDALSVVLPLERPADAVLRSWFRDNPQLGARDRALVADTIFATLRHLRWLEHLAGGRGPRRLALACLTRIAGYNLRALQKALWPGEAEWLGGLRTREDTAPDAVRLSMPDWLWERLGNAFPDEERIALARSLLSSAPMDLRVNALRVRRDEVLATLHASGIEAAATPLSPVGVRVKGKPSLERHALLTGGLAEVQDEGSQIVALLVDARRHQMVVDFCAGAGGKTLALGAAMRSEGRLYAFDTSEKRLANLKPRLRRSGLSNVHPQLIDSENDARVKRLAGKIDRVLVDAPCSGNGTLRRNPDLKWRMNPEALTELAAKQTSILRAAARLPKPGGRIVYATCSLLPEENEAIVAAFLAEHEGWSLLDVGELLRQAQVALDVSSPYLRLTPSRHHTDGFFAAVLARPS